MFLRGCQGTVFLVVPTHLFNINHPFPLSKQQQIWEPQLSQPIHDLENKVLCKAIGFRV